MDDNLIREFLMISLGVPPTENFTPTCARIILDKVWRVLSIHTEFQDLRIMDQRAVFGIVGPLGFALIVAKQENNTCAMTQLKVSTLFLHIHSTPDIRLLMLAKQCFQMIES